MKRVPWGDGHRRTMLIGLVVAMLVPAQALAGAVRRIPIAGNVFQVSCLRTGLCLTAGTALLAGNLTRVDGGRVDTYEEPVEAMLSVSCPSAAGCLAIGPKFGGRSEAMFSVGRNGVPPLKTPGTALPVPRGTTVGRIACVTLRACQMSGLDQVHGRWRLELGWWNGRTVAFHHLSLPVTVESSQGNLPQLADTSCAGVVCETVGYETNPSIGQEADTQGYIVTTRRGVPIGPIAYVPTYALHGVSCVSTSVCYVAGFSDDNVGGVFPVLHGRPGTPIPTPGAAWGVACARGTCTFAGAMVPQEGLDEGLIGTIAQGRVTSSHLVPRVSTEFTDVVNAGRDYAAVGLGPEAGVEFVTAPVGVAP